MDWLDAKNENPIDKASVDWNPQIQGSKAWLEQRRKRLGGSEIAAVLGISPWKTAFELWAEKTGKVVAEDISSKPHVLRGTLGEIRARERIEKETDIKFTPTVWTHPKYSYIGASDDGYVKFANGEAVILEIKCGSLELHQAVIDCKIPNYYECQVHWNMMVTGASKCVFASYEPETDDLAMAIVILNPVEQKRLLKAGLDFWENHVMTDSPPELTDKDYHEEKSEEFLEAVNIYKKAHAEATVAEKGLKDAKALIENFLKQGRAGVFGGGLKATRFSKKGNVIYGNIPELKEVDLEKYRGEPTLQTRITLEKINIKKAE